MIARTALDHILIHSQRQRMSSIGNNLATVLSSMFLYHFQGISNLKLPFFEKNRKRSGCIYSTIHENAI
jgi:hypothetical protein